MTATDEAIIEHGGKLKQLEKDVGTLQSDIRTIDDRTRQARLDYQLLTGKIDTVAEKINEHNNFHKEQKETKYKVTDIILAAGMIILTLFQVYIQFDQKRAQDAQARPATQFTFQGGLSRDN